MHHAKILIGHFGEMVGNWPWPAVILHSVLQITLSLAGGQQFHCSPQLLLHNGQQQCLFAISDLAGFKQKKKG